MITSAYGSSNCDSNAKLKNTPACDTLSFCKAKRFPYETPTFCCMKGDVSLYPMPHLACSKNHTLVWLQNQHILSNISGHSTVILHSHRWESISRRSWPKKLTVFTLSELKGRSTITSTAFTLPVQRLHIFISISMTLRKNWNIEQELLLN